MEYFSNIKTELNNKEILIIRGITVLKDMTISAFVVDSYTTIKLITGLLFLL